MKTSVLIGFFCAALAISAGAEDAARFHSVNSIVGELNPLDVIANHGGVRRSIDLDIRFGLASSQLLPAADVQLEALAEALLSTRLDGYNIQVVGHTDASGSAENNLHLSARRAESVMASLVKQFGVDPNRLIAEGKGETSLLEGLAANDSRNRRVEIVAVAREAAASQQQAVDTQMAEQPDAEGLIGADGEQKINW